MHTHKSHKLITKTKEEGEESRDIMGLRAHHGGSWPLTFTPRDVSPPPEDDSTPNPNPIA